MRMRASQSWMPSRSISYWTVATAPDAPGSVIVRGVLPTMLPKWTYVFRALRFLPSGPSWVQ